MTSARFMCYLLLTIVIRLIFLLADKNSIKRTGKRTNAFTNYDMLYPLYSTLHTGYNYN